jgi:hypothetical protein
VREERYDGVDAASTEGVVGEIGLVQQSVRFEGVAESSESEWDLGDETAGEYAGEVGDLCWQGGLVRLLHGINHVRWKVAGGSVICVM